jgi:hypothetical protein
MNYKNLIKIQMKYIEKKSAQKIKNKKKYGQKPKNSSPDPPEVEEDTADIA